MKVKNISRTFQGLFFEILRTPQGLVPSECSYKIKNDHLQTSALNPEIGKKCFAKQAQQFDYFHRMKGALSIASCLVIDRDQ